MIERDKEYYNKKIGELYAVIENQEKIIRDLQNINVGLQTRIKTIIRRRKRETHYKKKYRTRINKALKHTHEILDFLENCVGGNEQEIQRCIKIFNKYLELLKGEE